MKYRLKKYFLVALLLLGHAVESAQQLSVSDGKEANSNAQDLDGKTVLMKAVFQGNKDLVASLVKGTGINIQDKDGMTALMYARDADIFKLLLPESDLSVKDKLGRTVLMRNVQENKGALVDLLLKKLTKDQINARDKAGNSALFYALDLCVQSREGRRSPTSEFGESFPFYCCTNNPGNLDFVKKLIEYGADISLINNSGQTVLMVAINSCATTAVVEGLEIGERVPECACTAIGKVEVIKMLLMHKSNLHIQDTTGKSALDYAMNNMALIPLFLPYLSSDDKKKVFLNAVNKNNNDIINLLWAGVDLKGKDNNGKTWLIRAAESGNIDFAKKILSNNADQLNTQDSAGATALMYAAKAGNGPLVKFLLLQDANFRLKDKQGKQAVDYARQAGNKKVGEYIAQGLSDVEKLSMLLGRFPFGAQIQQTSIHEAVEKWKV